MSHSAAIENQNIESSDIKKKKRKRLFSYLALSIALAGAGSFAYWELVGSRYVKPITPIPMSSPRSSLLRSPVRSVPSWSRILRW